MENQPLKAVNKKDLGQGKN